MAFPPEVWRTVLSFLDIHSLYSMGWVSSPLRSLAAHDTLWQSRFPAAFPSSHTIVKENYRAVYGVYQLARKRLACVGPGRTLECTLVVLGLAGVGKSAWCMRFVRDMFVRDYDPTIEDSFRRGLSVDGAWCIVELIDTAGPDYLASLAAAPPHAGIILMYSIADRASYDGLDGVEAVLAGAGRVVAVVGTKLDLAHSRSVPPALGAERARRLGASFLEGSAWTGEGVGAAVEAAVRSCLIPWERVLAAAKADPRLAERVLAGRRGKCALM